MRIFILCIAALLGASSATVLSAQSSHGTSLAFVRAGHLRRGVNLSSWYAQTGDYSAGRLESHVTEQDFRLIHDAGFDNVRLSINPEPLIADATSATLRPEALTRLDHTVQQITSLGIAVVLDIHPEEPWKKNADTTDAGAKEFLEFWQHFAAHFAGTNPDLVYFEILNEPSADVYRWSGLQARLVADIRSVAPHHTIIATGGNWGGLDDLPLTEPVRDNNVIYSFHDYEPFTFTHQGANWMGPTVAITTGVPYPASPETIDSLLPAVTDESARIALVRYGEDRWDRRRIEQEISIVADWGRRKNVPVWCGEFGVYRAHANPEDRGRWIRDMRETLERNQIGWNMWDYQEGFALVSKNGPTPVADPAILAALGLTMKK